MKTILVLFGTRPEVIKLAPVIRALERASTRFRVIRVASSQHTSLLHPFVELFGIHVDHDLQVMRDGQSPNEVCSRVLAAIDPILTSEKPDAVLVQGDTTTALAGALAAFHRGIPVGHVEAGLRTGNPRSPFPEEMNRRLIDELSDYHFAATDRNRETLLAEGTAASSVFVTGNSVVDAVRWISERSTSSPRLEKTLHATRGFKRLLLTTHRRESHGAVLERNLRTLRDFVETHADVALIFPVHPNPSVTEAAERVLGGRPRVFLESPMLYEDFIGLAASSWLVVSDSGGIQEEAPTLGKAVLVLRENTERPEAVDAGVAKLVGGPERLAELLEQAYEPGSWVESVDKVPNPFGDGRTGERIAEILASVVATTGSAHDEKNSEPTTMEAS